MDNLYFLLNNILTRLYIYIYILIGKKKRKSN